MINVEISDNYYKAALIKYKPEGWWKDFTVVPGAVKKLFHMQFFPKPFLVITNYLSGGKFINSKIQ